MFILHQKAPFGAFLQGIVTVNAIYILYHILQLTHLFYTFLLITFLNSFILFKYTIDLSHIVYLFTQNSWKQQVILGWKKIVQRL